MVELSPFAAFFFLVTRDPDQQNFKIGSFPSKWVLEKKVQNTYNSISILGGGTRYFYPLKMVIGSS